MRVHSGWNHDSSSTIEGPTLSGVNLMLSIRVAGSLGQFELSSIAALLSNNSLNRCCCP